MNQLPYFIVIALVLRVIGVDSAFGNQDPCASLASHLKNLQIQKVTEADRLAYQEVVNNFIAEKAQKYQQTPRRSWEDKPITVKGKKYSYIAELGSGAVGTANVLQADDASRAIVKVFGSQAELENDVTNLALIAAQGVPVAETLGYIGYKTVVRQLRPGLSVEKALKTNLPETFKLQISSAFKEFFEKHKSVTFPPTELNTSVYIRAEGDLAFEVFDPH